MEVADSGLTGGEMRAWRGLLCTNWAVVRRLDAALEHEHGLSTTSFEVLQCLEGVSNERMRMCDLADHTLLSRSGLTRLIDRLERAELVERVSCADDARGAFAVLTSLGRERLAAARITHADVIHQEFLAHFTPAELAQLADFWQRVAPPPACCGHRD